MQGLTPTQIRLLAYLRSGAKSTQQLAVYLYGDASESALNAVWVHMFHLRKRASIIKPHRGWYALAQDGQPEPQESQQNARSNEMANSIIVTK